VTWVVLRWSGVLVGVVGAGGWLQRLSGWLWRGRPVKPALVLLAAAVIITVTWGG